MPAPRLARTLPLIGLLLATAFALAADPVRAALMIAPAPYRPKDFTMVKKDGIFHLFYIRRDVTLPMEESEFDLGHAISTDLYSWTQLPAVMHVRSDAWDNLHVWAPSIVERDGVYYMFYTGVSDSAGRWDTWQRTGLATSTDLTTWNRLDQPIYSCVDVPWSWCDSTNFLTGFRDPFVMPDPATPGHWLMYTSTFPASDTAGMIVGVATSDGDFTRWTDLKPLWITNEAYSYNAIVESPHLFRHGDLWFLFFTTNAGQPISYAFSHDPTADVNGWVYRGRLSTMLGIDTHTWIASEYFQNGTHEYFMFVNYNRIEIYEMVWTSAETFVLYEPGAFHITGMAWNASSAAAGDSLSLAIAAAGWSMQSASLEAVEVLPGGVEAPLSMDSLGLPATVPLTADTTRVAWTARIRHASGDSTSALTLIVRTTDRTAEAGPLTISPPAFQMRALAWSANPVTAWTAETLAVVSSGGSGRSVGLEAVELLAGGGEAAVALGALGLPDSVRLASDTTRVPWIARIRHASGDTTATLRLLVRTTDPSVSSPPLTVSPQPLVLCGLDWSASSVRATEPVTLRLCATHWAGQGVALEALELLPDSSEVPVAPESLGLPDSVAFTADTTLLSWVARIHHASGDTTSEMRLRVRSRDRSTTTPWLTILPSSEPPALEEGTNNSPPERLRTLLRTLQHSPVGPAALLVTLPAPTPVRIDLFDLQGRRVRNLVNRVLNRGSTVVSWDGQDAGGAQAARGMYFARMITPRGTHTARLLLLP